MVLAAYRDNFYDLFLLLHIVAVLAAFAPAFVGMVVSRQVKAAGGDVRALSQAQVVTWLRMSLPSMVLAGFFGIVLIILSDDVIKFSQSWVTLAFLVWIAMVGLLAAGIVPALRRYAGGDEKSFGQLSMLTGVMHLMLLVMLYLMIFKPGT